MVREARGLAKDARTRLVKVVTSGVPVRTDPDLSNPLQERFAGKLVKYHLQSFANMWAGIALIVSGYLLLFKGSKTLSFLITLTAIAIFIIGRKRPQIFLPWWRAWMLLAKILSSITTPLLLSAVWLVIVIPIALLLKLFGISRVSTQFKGNSSTYWKVRDAQSQEFARLYKQY